MPVLRRWIFTVITHADIDARILRMLQACAAKIDRDPSLLSRVANNTTRIADPRIKKEWEALLALPWPELRAQLLVKSDRGYQLRQNAPFYGILTEAERMSFFRRPTA